MSVCGVYRSNRQTVSIYNDSVWSLYDFACFGSGSTKGVPLPTDCPIRGPIRRRKYGYILTTDQSDAGATRNAAATQR
eukprot:4934440-Pyramimonas_sp.AAC.3